MSAVLLNLQRNSRRKCFRLRTALLTAMLLTSASAIAGVFDEDARREVKELRSEFAKKDSEIEARLSRLDESIKSLGIIQLLNQIEMLRAELAKLRGQIETVSNQNDQISNRQRDFYLDLDTRLRKVEGQQAVLPNDATLRPVETGLPSEKSK